MTYRTSRVLAAIAGAPGASNREIAANAGVHDQGQISKLLTRLEKLGLVHNTGLGHEKGEANEWSLTPAGHQVTHSVIPPQHATPTNPHPSTVVPSEPVSVMPRKGTTK